ncbi:MAG: PD40 domain-containing protein [Candidatus Hydrogenedentes bacterium]|nr:PD40 domain-containing protein [Candidatus Hydrogenedentota bacterium]
MKLGKSVVFHFLVLSALVASAAEAPVQLTDGNRRDTDPAVSPDGSRLAFASNRTGTFNIFTLDLNKRASGVSQLTQGNKDDRYPFWSPDSKKLVFTSKRTGNGDIYELSASGDAGNLQLTDREEVEEYASFSPRGDDLLIAEGPKKLVKIHPDMSVVLMKKSGSRYQGKTLGKGDEPRFSPDGKKIVFTSRRTKNNDVWLMNVDGGLQTQLTTDSKSDENPAFSPDGKHIVFASNRTGNYDIWVMDADGGSQRQLTFDTDDETQPCWSTGGYVYYTLRLDETHSAINRIKAP